MNFKMFMDQFAYRQTKAGYIGIEREAFLLDCADRIVPHVRHILPEFNSEDYDYELSASQLEHRIGPTDTVNLRRDLVSQANEMRRKLSELRMDLLYVGAGPTSVPLDHHPCDRYNEIVALMPKRVLKAAVRVAGTHIHIGMPDRLTALATYNRVVDHTDELCEMGDQSNGERRRLFSIITNNLTPKKQPTWYEYYQTAMNEEFHDDLGKCWWWIRISRFGTIEFRMFDTTESVDQIVEWANYCHKLCFPE